MKRNIVFATDNRFAMHVSVAITSILRTCSNVDTLRFYILTEGLREEHQEKLKKTVPEGCGAQLYIVKVDATPFKRLPKTNWPLTAYFRIIMSDLFPFMEKALYLDGDVIVIDNIMDLYDINISSFYAAVVRDCMSSENRKRLLLPEKQTYFNSGVMLMNLKLWRKNSIQNNCLNFAQRNKGKLKLYDQDILNCCIGANILLLPMRWNTSPYYRACYDYSQKEHIQILNKAGIVHFWREYKPWLIPSKFEISYKEKYFDNLRLTPYKQFYYFYNRRKAFYTTAMKIISVLPGSFVKKGFKRLWRQYYKWSLSRILK